MNGYAFPQFIFFFPAMDKEKEELPPEPPLQKPPSPAALPDHMVTSLYNSLSGHDEDLLPFTQDSCNLPLAGSLIQALQDTQPSTPATLSSPPPPPPSSPVQQASPSPSPMSQTPPPPSSPVQQAPPPSPSPMSQTPPPPSQMSQPPPPLSPPVTQTRPFPSQPHPLSPSRESSPMPPPHPPKPKSSSKKTPARTSTTPSRSRSLSASRTNVPPSAPATTIVVKKPNHANPSSLVPSILPDKNNSHHQALHVQTQITSNCPMVNSPYTPKTHASENIRHILQQMSTGLIPGFQNIGALSIIFKHAKALRSGQFAKEKNSFPLPDAQSPLDVLVHQYVLLNLSHVVKQTSEIESLENQISFHQKRTKTLQTALETPSHFETSFNTISNSLQRHKSFHNEVIASYESDAATNTLRHQNELSRLSTQITDLHLQVQQFKDHAEKQSGKLKNAREQIASDAREQSISQNELQTISNKNRLLAISLQEKGDEITALRLDKDSSPSSHDFQALQAKLDEETQKLSKLLGKHTYLKKAFSKLCKRTELALNEEENLLRQLDKFSKESSSTAPPRSPSAESQNSEPARSRSPSSGRTRSRTSSTGRHSCSPSSRKSDSPAPVQKDSDKSQIVPCPSVIKTSSVQATSLPTPSTSQDFPPYSNSGFAKTTSSSTSKPDDEEDSLQLSVNENERSWAAEVSKPKLTSWETVRSKPNKRIRQKQLSPSPTATSDLPLLKVDLPRVREMTQGLYTRTHNVLKRLVSQIGTSLLHDQALINALRRSSLPEAEAHHIVNNFCKGLSQCQTINAITSFLKNPSVKDNVAFQIWPDFRDNSVEWNFLMADTGTKHFVNFDRLICLFRCYNTQLYEFFRYAKTLSPEEQSKCFKLLYNRDFDFNQGRKSLWEKKLDILILLIVARISFYVEDDMPRYLHNSEYEYHCLSTPFTLQWKEEMYQIRKTDPYLLSPKTFHFLFVDNPTARNALHEWSQVTNGRRTPPYKKSKSTFLTM